MWLWTSSRRRALVLGLGRPQGATHLVEVVGVGHLDHVPAVGQEAGGDVLREGDVGVTLDRHPVGVVDPAQVGQLLVAREGGRLRGDALHHAAVTGQRVDVEVEQRVAVPVVAGGQPLAGQRHADRRGDSLAERAGGRLHPARPPVLRVARAAGAQLAEGLDVVERDGRPAEHLVVGIDRAHPAQVQERPQQRGRVPLGQHEAVAVGPDGITGVEAEDPLPELVGHRRDAHRGPRMAGLGLLDGVHAQAADGVDGQLVQLAGRHVVSWSLGARARRSGRWTLASVGRAPEAGANRAAPTMPASLWSCAGTTSVRSVDVGEELLRTSCSPRPRG